MNTQEAAVFLNVSRAYLERLLDDGKIDCHVVGETRRILFADVLKYKEHRKKISDDALQTLADQAQELDMGYETDVRAPRDMM